MRFPTKCPTRLNNTAFSLISKRANYLKRPREIFFPLYRPFWLFGKKFPNTDLLDRAPNWVSTTPFKWPHVSIFCTVVIYEYFLVDQYRFYSTDLMHCFLTSGDNGWLCIYSTIDLFSCDFSWMKHFTRHFCLLQKDKIYIY